MRLLITTDAVGGVWTYTEQLTRELLRREHRVTVACFGPEPSKRQRRWLAECDVECVTLPCKLEWMADCRNDISAARTELAVLIEQYRPDLLHSNQFCFGALDCSIPTVIVAHSDVVSWWHAVHGEDPNDGEFPDIDFYRETVEDGIAGADVVVGISQQVLTDLTTHYAQPRRSLCIHNGIDPDAYDYRRPKQPIVLAAGRDWDKAKNLAILRSLPSELPIRIAGAAQADGVRDLGLLSAEELREQYAIAQTFVSPALYEPFGLAVLEAALSGCRLLLSDIPTFRSLWGEHAEYFDPRAPVALADKLRRGVDERGAREHALARYTAEEMARSYESLYRELVGDKVAAA